MVERFHHTLKAALMSHCNSSTWYRCFHGPFLAFRPYPKMALTCQQQKWDLHTGTLVFIRTDAVRPPLTQPYVGPYRVIDHKQKAFLIDIHGTTDWVAIDCLEPVYLLDDNTPPVQYSSLSPPAEHLLVDHDSTRLTPWQQVEPAG
ncbi:uncharacterized protein [Macrobrachium rosenbergii]|uniref:uncharacterized protein n=1 Tax=Macrobrachium rosenbergii TaxID=79674 RepID=UPI0034D5D1D4